jgi:hypothetical protein
VPAVEVAVAEEEAVKGDGVAPGIGVGVLKQRAASARRTTAGAEATRRENMDGRDGRSCCQIHKTEKV